MTAGLVFDKYEVVKRIAVGGMGEVFLAQQKGLPGFERLVILKSLLPVEGAAAEINAHRFLDEARLAAKLNHPNVVSIFEAGAWGGRFFIAMEYIPGWNLAQLLRKAHELQLVVDPWVCAHMVRDAARGLHHAHAAPDAHDRPLGIVHRDVSPQNIIVRKDGLAKVVDFGVAWALERESKTQAGTIVGKIAYMAPEQLTGETLDARCDQYALGVVFWELLTARRLYGGKKSEAEVAKAVLTSQVPHPSTLAPGVPPELGDVAMRMLSATPARRYPRCEDVALALDELLRPRPQTSDDLKALIERLGPVPAETELATPGDFVLGLSKKPAPPPPKSKLPLFAGAAVLIAGVVAFAVTREAPVAAVEPAPVPGPQAEVVAKVAPAPKPEPELPERGRGPRPVAPAPKPVPAPKPEKAEAPKSTAPGFLSINTDPWVSVRVDGQSIGHTPLSKVELPAGTHRLELVNEDEGIRKPLEVTIASGEVRKVILGPAQLRP